MSLKQNSISIAIDRGGTFTDIVAFIPGQKNYIFKLLSVDPLNYKDANIEGIRRVLEHASGTSISRDVALDTSYIKCLKLGTTVATNALLERTGERCALITTKGFKDALIIGNQTRPDIFDLRIKRPSVLYDTVIEIDERVTLEDFTEDPSKSVTDVDGDALTKGASGDTVRILQKPKAEEIRAALKALKASGINSLAVCLLHSYTFPDHEILVGRIAAELGFGHISLSSLLSPMIKFIPRANSSVADAYLTPEIKKYLDSFEQNLSHGILSSTNPKGVKCQFMKSDGGLVEAAKFSGLRAILSGPAGGTVGLAKSFYDSKRKIPLIGLDVGGTSTDCSRFAGIFEHVFETTTAGITIQSPQLDINTIAAGGGSRLFFENGLMRVGPESAGADPGPVCYRKGGYLTITDANLILNRLVPEFFPKIFGPNENESLDVETTVLEFQKLTDRINANSGQSLTAQQVAEGFLQVANEAMARPVRTLTESKGHVLSSHRLVSFGGGGGQCACFVAFDSLGINTVLMHKYSSVLSAFGMALADVVDEIQEPCSLILENANSTKIEAAFERLVKKGVESLTAQDIARENIKVEKYLNLRYQGTESAIMTSNSDSVSQYIDEFVLLHVNEFGFKFDEKKIIIDDIRVRVIGSTYSFDQVLVDDQIETLENESKVIQVAPDNAKFIKRVFFRGQSLDTPIFVLENLQPGSKINGPAIIVDGTQTNVIPPDAYVMILENHLVVTNTREIKQRAQEDRVDPILLSIFGHKFIDIAEQMGYALQKTSVSTNVKERLDFSCALFDADANLVSSAPHIPVHLGSMATFVKFQAEHCRGRLSPGDVIVGNHPGCGTHLPDITVLTPVFYDGKITFYVASRAHHSDIGSILPGSMPPNSRELWEEGAIIFSEYLVKDLVFQEERMTQLLLHEPARYPGCSGTRKLSDNLSDLKAQVAANQKGIGLIHQLIEKFTLATVQLYTSAIQHNAAQAVLQLLKTFPNAHLQAEESMDDGSKILLTVSIDKENGKSIFDFTGTSPEVYSNLNAPIAITYSAIIYCLRCLVNKDIPLNQGFLQPLEIIIPENSLLSPSPLAAVVAGNVLTSQRITDVIFHAFGALAGSQGCCNNFTFGYGGNTSEGYVEGFGYYETIAGGHGAGPDWDGVSAVHTNMTNTKMTDVEVFEKRYPVIVHEFGIREGTGGDGKFRGGSGAKREIEFRMPLTVSILSERRVIAPYGLDGGLPGEKGLNIWKRHYKDGTVRDINIGGKNTINVQARDHVTILTPGGGGYGAASDRKPVEYIKPIFKRTGGSLANRHETQYTN